MPRTNSFDFGEDPVPDTDTIIYMFFFFSDSLQLREWARNYMEHDISKRCGRIWMIPSGLVG